MNTVSGIHGVTKCLCTLHKQNILKNIKVWLSFNDGAEGEIDLTSELHGEVFEPLKDKTFFKSFTFSAGARYVGPNTLGLLSVDKAVLGMMGGRAASALSPGSKKRQCGSDFEKWRYHLTEIVVNLR